MNNLYQIIITISIISCSLSTVSIAQTKLTNSGSDMVMQGGYLVFENTQFVNNSNFNATGGTVLITGDGTNENALIASSNNSTFYNLEINKTTNGALLGNEITVSNQLILTNGNFVVGASDLIIGNAASISGGTANSYIQTTDSGSLILEAGNSNVLFPVGNQSYTPVTLSNVGVTDNFVVRVENVVYEDGLSGNIITTDVVDATWHISPQNGNAANVSASFQWNATDELTSFNRTQAFVSNYHDSMWNNGTISAALGSNPYTLTESGITTFSPFAIASNAAILPIELIYFYAEQQAGDVLLSWETATEINNDYFEIEFSLDGITFEKIGQVKGAGTTVKNQSYEFLHDLKDVVFQNEQALYYRLKQVDFDEKFEYTPIINVIIDSSNPTSLEIYPNPARHYLNIESKYLMGETIQIFNANGQLVKEFLQENLMTRLSIRDFVSGTYFIRIGSEIRKVVVLE